MRAGAATFLVGTIVTLPLFSVVEMSAETLPFISESNDDDSVCREKTSERVGSFLLGRESLALRWNRSGCSCSRPLFEGRVVESLNGKAGPW